MKPRNVSMRGKVMKQTKMKPGYPKELVITGMMCFVLIAVTLGAIFWYQNIQARIVCYINEAELREKQIAALENDVKRLDVESARRQSMNYIAMKIREFNLPLRPTETSQILIMERSRATPEFATPASGTYTAETFNP